MSAAAMQGSLTTTLDTDIWVDLPERQYPRLMNIVTRLGGKVISQTLYTLDDGRLVNFLFRLTGLRSFAAEYRGAVTGRMDGERVKILPLTRILASKRAIMRDKDKLHILLIERLIKGRKAAKKK